MIYIKEFEEYSEDDLTDLIGDLSDIGHQNHLIQGKDFGFGPDLKGENDGRNIFFLTNFAIEQIKNSKILAPPASIVPYRIIRGLIKGPSMPVIKISKSKYHHWGIPTSYPEQIGEASDDLYFVTIKSELNTKQFPNEQILHRRKGRTYTRQEVSDIYNDFLNIIKEIKVK